MREEGLILEIDYKQCEIEITLHCDCQFRGAGAKHQQLTLYVGGEQAKEMTYLIQN